jgi:hypothetical protein
MRAINTKWQMVKYKKIATKNSRFIQLENLKAFITLSADSRCAPILDR